MLSDYTPQLLALDRYRPRHRVSLPDNLQQITTPLRLETWKEELAHHPDRRLAEYILHGIENGFRVGFNYNQQTLVAKGTNMLSAMQVPQVIEEYLREEVLCNRIVELTQSEACQLGIHCSPFGVIPKKNKPNKWRLIVDLSAPEGSSVNDGIARDLCSTSYLAMDEVIACIVRLGKESLIAKMDIKQAYRNVPIHPDDRRLLGMKWRDQVFVDKVLPFGLRSAPLIFTALADCLQWIMQRRGASPLFHYLDDFLTVGRPQSDQCASNMQIMKQACSDTGTPIEPDKCEGPATVMGFLGLELDTEKLEMRLPQDKLHNLLEAMSSWRGRKACRKRELLSLIGSLSHACKAVRPGRAFLRRLIDLSSVVKHLDHYVRLSRSARSDIEWWYRFASKWNGSAMMSVVSRNQPDITVSSDASGSWGCGALCGSLWFQLKWAGAVVDSHITVKELVPIVIAAAIWGEQWAGSTVLANCDNAAVVAIINQGSSKDQECMHLMRCLSFIAAQFNFNLVAAHIKGVDNTLADALSRNNALLFFAQLPHAHPDPSTIPPELLDLLLLSKPDWTSQHWTELWSSIFDTA